MSHSEIELPPLLAGQYTEVEMRWFGRAAVLADRQSRAKELPALTDVMLQYAMQCMHEVGGEKAKRLRSFWYFVSEAYRESSTPAPLDDLKRLANDLYSEGYQCGCPSGDAREGWLLAWAKAMLKVANGEPYDDKAVVL